MVDKISDSNGKNIQIPYRPSDAKSTKFDYKNNIFLPSVKSFKQPAKLTQAEELHQNWHNVNPNLSMEFFDEIIPMSKRLKCDPKDLAALIYEESRFDPKANGSDGKYRGLIQMTSSSLENCIEYSKKNSKDGKFLPDISMNDYVKLPREKQIFYAETYLHMIKDECGLKNKKVTGGQLWGMIKSPRLIKENNKNFQQKLEVQLDSIKDIPLKYEAPYYIKRHQQ